MGIHLPTLLRYLARARCLYSIPRNDLRACTDSQIFPQDYEDLFGDLWKPPHIFGMYTSWAPPACSGSKPVTLEPCPNVSHRRGFWFKAYIGFGASVSSLSLSLSLSLALSLSLYLFMYLSISDSIYLYLSTYIYIYIHIYAGSGQPSTQQTSEPHAV